MSLSDMGFDPPAYGDTMATVVLKFEIIIASLVNRIAWLEKQCGKEKGENEEPVVFPCRELD